MRKKWPRLGWPLAVVVTATLTFVAFSMLFDRMQADPNLDYTPRATRQDLDRSDSPFGRADRFLDFLRKELIPAVEGRYRASGLRILAGNSRGGLFVVYALTIDPRLFFSLHAPGQCAAVYTAGFAVDGRSSIINMI